MAVALASGPFGEAAAAASASLSVVVAAGEVRNGVEEDQSVEREANIDDDDGRRERGVQRRGLPRRHHRGGARDQVRPQPIQLINSIEILFWDLWLRFLLTEIIVWVGQFEELYHFQCY